MNDKYRLYIDESGTHRYKNSEDVKERYLCLNGVIVSSDHNQEFIVPNWDGLRSIFTEDQDFPAVFHLTDVMSKKGLFKKLEDEKFRKNFDKRYLEILSLGNFSICSVVLDKKSHLEKYGESAMHPYHYCLNVLLERYVKFLLDCDSYGDVVAEVRGKDEDRLLSSEFQNFYEGGTYYLRAETVQQRLTSKNLKLKTKEARIAGLELSDMLALPMKFLTLYEYQQVSNLSDNFTHSVIELIRPKIRRSPYDRNKIKGFGIKLV